MVSSLLLFFVHGTSPPPPSPPCIPHSPTYLTPPPPNRLSKPRYPPHLRQKPFQTRHRHRPHRLRTKSALAVSICDELLDTKGRGCSCSCRKACRERRDGEEKRELSRPEKSEERGSGRFEARGYAARQSAGLLMECAKRRWKGKTGEIWCVMTFRLGTK